MELSTKEFRNRRKNLRRALLVPQREQHIIHRGLPTVAVQRALQDPSSLHGSDLIDLQRVIGNRAVASLLSAQRSPQTSQEPGEGNSSLSVGPSNDDHERAAHQVAGQVSGGNAVQRTSGLDVGDGGGPISQSLESKIQSAKSGGQPVPDHVQRAMENATGADYSDVRVHDGAEAQSVNEGLGARAATQGKHIFLGRNQSPDNLKLMAHELTHTVQQGAVKNANGVQRVATPGGAPAIQRDELEEKRKRYRKLKKKIGQKKAKKALVKATKFGAKGFDWLLTAPLRLIDQLSVMDLHAKDFGDFIKTGQTFRQRRKPEKNSISPEYKKAKSKRTFGRTGLRADLNGNKYHKMIYDNVLNERKLKLPWQGKANPFWNLGQGIGDLGKKDKSLGKKIGNLEQEKTGLYNDLHYNAGDLEMPDELQEEGGFTLNAPEEDDDLEQ